MAADPGERLAYLKMRRAVAGESTADASTAEAVADEAAAEGLEPEAVQPSSLSPERYAAMSAGEQDILTVSANGFGKRTSSYEYRITGRGEVKKVAPALTLGWGGSNRSGFYLGTEGGILFQGKVRVRNFANTGTLANNAAFRADLERERLSLQDDVDDFKIYPIAQFSIGYRF